MQQLQLDNISKLILVRSTEQVYAFLTTYYIPPDVAIILYDLKTSKLKLPILREANEKTVVKELITQLGSNVYLFYMSSESKIQFAVIQMLFIYIQKYPQLKISYDRLLFSNEQTLEELNKLVNDTSRLFTDLYTDIKKELDFKMLRQLNTPGDISMLKSKHKWGELSYYLNHLLYNNMITIEYDSIVCKENNYRNYIINFAVKEKLKQQVLDPSELSENGQSLYEFASSDYPESKFKFVENSLIVNNLIVHCFDFAIGQFKFTSTFRSADNLSQFMFFEDVKRFFNHLVITGQKMFKYYTKVVDWKTHGPKSLNHQPYAFNRTKLLLNPEFSDDVDYFDYVTRYCYLKYKTPPQWFDTSTALGYTGILLIGGFWQIEARKTFKLQHDLQYHLCKLACKNKEYGIIDYVDTVEAVHADPDSFKNKKMKFDQQQLWSPKSVDAVPHALELKNNQVSIVKKSAVQATLSRLKAKETFWHLRLQSPYSIELPAKSNPIVFKKPKLLKITEESAKEKAETLIFGEIKSISLVAIELACQIALKNGYIITLDTHQLNDLKSLAPVEQYWYKKLILFKQSINP